MFLQSFLILLPLFILISSGFIMGRIFSFGGNAPPPPLLPLLWVTAYREELRGKSAFISLLGLFYGLQEVFSAGYSL